MIEMSRFALSMIVLGAGMLGCAATIGMILCSVQNDRRGRAKAKRQRDHRMRAVAR
jgi:hypothetical protein